MNLVPKLELFIIHTSATTCLLTLQSDTQTHQDLNLGNLYNLVKINVLHYGKIKSIGEDNDQYLDLEVQVESEGNGEDNGLMQKILMHHMN